MGTKTVVETKKSIEIKYLPDFRRLVKLFAFIVVLLSVLIAAYLLSPSNLVVGAITLVSFGVVGLFIVQSIYGLILFKRYFL